MTGWLALLGATLAYGLAAVLQAMGARRREGLRALLQPLYLAGLLADALAFVLLAVALDSLTEAVANAVLAASIGVTVVLARYLMHVTMRRRDVLALVGIVLGTALIALGDDDGAAPALPSSLVPVLVVAALALVVVTALLWRRAPANALAIVSGLGFLVVTLASTAISRLDPNPEAADATPIPVLVALGCLVLGGAVATLAQLRAFQTGAVGPVVSLANGTSVIAAVVIGPLYLGDSVGVVWMSGVGILALLVSCVVLAFSDGMAQVTGGVDAG